MVATEATHLHLTYTRSSRLSLIMSNGSFMMVSLSSADAMVAQIAFGEGGYQCAQVAERRVA